MRSITACLPVSGWVKSLQLSFFEHLARTAPEEDHHRVIAAALRPPAEWRRPVGRPRTTWLRTIDDELMTFSPWTLESTRLRGRQEIWTFGIKSSVRQLWSSPTKKKTEQAVTFAWILMSRFPLPRVQSPLKLRACLYVCESVCQYVCLSVSWLY